MQHIDQETFLDWEHALLSLAADLRQLSHEATEWPVLFLSKRSLQQTSRSTTASANEDIESAPRSSKWEDGLNKIAKELRELAHGVFVQSVNKPADGKLMQIRTLKTRKVTRSQEKDTSEWELGLKRLVHDVKKHSLKTYLLSRKGANSPQTYSSNSSKATKLPSQRNEQNRTRHKCCLSNFVSELKNVSSKVRKDLHAHQYTHSSQKPSRHRSEGAETNAVRNGANERLEVRESFGKKISKRASRLSQREAIARRRSCSAVGDIQRPEQTKNLVVPEGTKNPDIQEVDRNGKASSSTSTAATQRSAYQIVDTEMLSSWGFSLRSLSQRVYKVAHAARQKSLNFYTEGQDPHKMPFLVWAAEKSGQDKLSNWEHRLLSLSNEMWKVAHDIGGKS